jgi:hypothetical protein
MDDYYAHLAIHVLGPPLVYISLAVVGELAMASADLVAYLACETQAVAAYLLPYLDAGAAPAAECLDNAVTGRLFTDSSLLEQPTLRNGNFAEP